MKVQELIVFLKMCDFNSIHPIIEGEKFYTRKELEDWFLKEAR